MLAKSEAQRNMEIPEEPFKLHFVLKFVWTDKVLGVALNQANKRGETPMSPYFFWPREDAWECVQKVSAICFFAAHDARVIEGVSHGRKSAHSPLTWTRVAAMQTNDRRSCLPRNKYVVQS